MLITTHHTARVIHVTEFCTSLYVPCTFEVSSRDVAQFLALRVVNTALGQTQCLYAFVLYFAHDNEGVLPESKEDPAIGTDVIPRGHRTGSRDSEQHEATKRRGTKIPCAVCADGRDHQRYGKPLRAATE